MATLFFSAKKSSKSKEKVDLIEWTTVAIYTLIYGAAICESLLGRWAKHAKNWLENSLKKEMQKDQRFSCQIDHF